MAASLSSSDLEKAKEAISILSSLVPASGCSNGTGSTENQGCSSTKVYINDDTTGSAKPGGRRQDMIKAADKALNALRGMKTCPKRKKRIKSEMEAIFPAKKLKKCSWKHRFVCLSRQDQTRIPTTDTEKDDLLKAGLGEKVVEFSDIDVRGEEFRDILYSAYPKLRNAGGFQFFRCIPNTRKLDVLSETNHSSPSVLKERVGNSRTYIRPLQRDLEMESVVSLPEGPKEECLSCGKFFALCELPDHVEACCNDLFYDSYSEISLSPKPYSPITQTSANQSTYLNSNSELHNIDNEFVQTAIKQSIEMDETSFPLPSGSTEFPKDDRRNHLLKDAMREARKKPSKHLKVTFVGEGAIDQGGPRREFFRLVAMKASEVYLYGEPHKKFFVNNVTALKNNEFKYLGQLTVMSISQGGNGFPYLSDVVYRYITSGELTHVDIPFDDLPDTFLKFAVKKINEADDGDSLQAAVAIDEIGDLISQTGHTSLITMNTKEEVISSLLDYHLMAKVKSMMDQFMDGLKVLGLLSAIQAKPNLWKPLFVAHAIITPEELKNLFQILFAEKGTKLRSKQEQAFVHFVDFIDECSDGVVECSLGDILVFFSGASSIPPLGFDQQPTISFNHFSSVASSSTCDLQLRLPLIHETNYDSFREAMILSLKGNDGFGGI